MKIKQQNQIKTFLLEEFGVDNGNTLFEKQEKILNEIIKNTKNKSKKQMETLIQTILPRIALYKALKEEFDEEKFTSIIKLLKLYRSFNNYEIMLNTEKPNYSLGEARRINFARMLYSNAKYILMDEPFASLDEENRLIMENVILLQKDKCIVITSHVVSSDFLSKVNIKIDL